MKQVIVVNKSIDLSAGKLAAQVAHASVATFLEATTPEQQKWINEGMPKIVLAAPEVEALEDLLSLASDRGLPAELVRDAGKTVLAPGTVTCLGIGPANDDDIDRLTGRLALY